MRPEARAHDHEGDEHGLLFAPRDAGEALRLVRRGLSPIALVLSGREGRVHTPEQAAAAIEAGAFAVIVGTAITHPTSITTWFKAAVEG